MKRTILSLLVVGLFTGVGTSAMAQNVTAGDQPVVAEKSGTQTEAYPEAGTNMQKPETAGAAEQSIPNADKNAARDRAQMEYKIAKAKCDDLKGSAIGACVTDAKAVRDDALKQAKKQSKDKGAANESDTATPPQQQAEKGSTDQDAPTTTN